MTSVKEAASTKATAFPFADCAACLIDQMQINASQGDVVSQTQVYCYREV